MKKFFPNYISHVIQLLDKYYEFTASKDSNKIAVLPILLERIAKHVYEICNDIGLVPCTENLQKDNTLISKLNRAWGLFLGELKPNPGKKGEGS
jgi:hypothetical protein